TPPVLSAEAAKRLDAIDQMASSPSRSGRDVRVESLRLLHSKEVEDFIKRDGFGVRRIPTPSVRYLSLPPGPSIPFDAVSYKESDLDGEAGVTLPATEKAEADRRSVLPSLESLERLHQFGEGIFLTRDSFGLIKDKKNVAGFEPHQFR